MTDELELPAQLDLAAAGRLQEALLARRGQDVTLDAAKVSFVGGLGLQVLLVAARTWQADGHAFRIAAPSDGFREGLAGLGLGIDVFDREVSA